MSKIAVLRAIVAVLCIVVKLTDNFEKTSGTSEIKRDKICTSSGVKRGLINLSK